jgi:sugar phosphate isomerase/epimerase
MKNPHERERLEDSSMTPESADRHSAPTRRDFLRFGAMAIAGGTAGRAALAASQKPPQPPPPKETKRQVLVGGHLWVYAASQPNYDATPVLENVFADFTYAGIAELELMDRVLRHPDAVEHIGNLSEQYSLPIVGSSYEAPMWDRSKHPAILEDAETVITRLAKLHGRTLGTSVGQAPAPKTPEQLDAQAEVLRKIIALCNAHNIVLNLHNHTYEVENHEHDLQGTLARIPDVKLGPDLNWLIRAGEDPVDFLRRYSDRIVFLHLRDQKADGKWSEALGEGNTDFRAIGRELHRIKFSGDAVIELAFEKDFTPTRPLRDSWKMSREYVRKTLGY